MCEMLLLVTRILHEHILGCKWLERGQRKDRSAEYVVDFLRGENGGKRDQNTKMRETYLEEKNLKGNKLYI